MFAIIKSGGKQYKVSEGAVVKLEKLDHGVGETLSFDQILLLSKNDGEVCVDAEALKTAKVSAEVITQARDKKVSMIKFRRRKHSMKRQGHRQYYTEVKITSIEAE